jgi:ubiquinone/menaquinone biosynthesis C-methylase UbiE
MAHKFDPKDSWKLDNPERIKMLPPDETLKKLGLKGGDIIADIGCGNGYFAIPALKIVGPAGRVYAVDTSDEMLEQLRQRLSETQFQNIIITRGGEHDPGLEDESITFVLMSNVLHEIEDRVLFLKRIKKALKRGGKLAVIDWQKKQTSLGPPVEHRLDSEYVAQLLQERGFQILSVKDIHGEVYAITAVSSQSPPDADTLTED